jgi:hypothetical protein
LKFGYFYMISPNLKQKKSRDCIYFAKNYIIQIDILLSNTHSKTQNIKIYTKLKFQLDFLKKMLKLIQLSVLFFGRFPFLYMLVFFFTLFIQNRSFLLAISYSRDKQKFWNKITWLSSIDFRHYTIFFLII